MATLGFEDYIDPLKNYLQKYREVFFLVKIYLVNVVLWLYARSSKRLLLFFFLLSPHLVGLWYNLIL